MTFESHSASPHFAALSDAVSRDDAFLREHLAGVIRTDDFTERLWRVRVLRRAGWPAPRRARHPPFRYMLDVPGGLPLQVEVNTVSTSFMSLPPASSRCTATSSWPDSTSYGGGGDAESALPRTARRLAADTLAADGARRATRALNF